MTEFLHVQEEVLLALKAKKPVVALESTVIAHGLPYPINIETGLALEEIVRSHGATPATICLKDGKIAVGLSPSDMEQLGQPKQKLAKLSTRDLGFALSQKLFGATTVAATMHCAALAGINVFATGGIGGVHRDGHLSLDMSADLTELSRTKVTVVCAGAKSILDIRKTLEVLETLRVPVIGYQTNNFPSFYSRTSGHRLDNRLDTAHDIAKLMAIHFSLTDTGIVVANPIAAHDQITEEKMEILIDAALAKAHINGIAGGQVTPYLLKQLYEMSEGKTLVANIALLKNNAALAATISVAASHYAFR